MKQKPVIGLTMRLESDTRRFYLGRDYCEALEGLGAIPLHIALIPNKNYIKEVLKRLDGVLLPGSDTDVDPLRFNEEPHHNLGKIIPEKDETDLLVIEEAEKLGMPVLAICFGMQILNVFRSGTLIQDIKSQIPDSINHEQGSPLDRNSHSIEIEKGTILSRLITLKETTVNSHHHQAVNKIGKNLQISATAKDGIVEGIEDTREEKFNFGVQWHPEHSWKTNDLSRKIFETFIERATKYNSERNK